MRKRIAFFVLLLLFNVFFINAAKVEITTYIYKEGTFFEYDVFFNKNESFSSFSFEKPHDAKMIYALEDGYNVDYSVAGDYFIIKPEETSNRNFTIRFSSISKSQSIVDEGLFSVYANFNFPVENLKFRLAVKEEMGGEISEVVPRNYEVDRNGEYTWDLEKVNSDTFFLIKFGDKRVKDSAFLLFIEKYWHIGFLILVLFVFIGAAVVFKRKGYTQKININNINVNPFKKKEKKVKQEIVDEEKFEELTLKYLTENEREVLNVIKNNQGISQYDILNYLPTMTKSNLSKIVSKLELKKFVNRIKVGKVNKIYLGEKIEIRKDDETLDL